MGTLLEGNCRQSNPADFLGPRVPMFAHDGFPHACKPTGCCAPRHCVPPNRLRVRQENALVPPLRRFRFVPTPFKSQHDILLLPYQEPTEHLPTRAHHRYPIRHNPGCAQVAITHRRGPLRPHFHPAKQWHHLVIQGYRQAEHPFGLGMEVLSALGWGRYVCGQ